MNFIINLPKSKGYSVILLVVDLLSNYTHFIPLREDFYCIFVSDAFIFYVAKLRRIPKSIVNNQGNTFTNRFWQYLFRSMETTLSFSTAYHPQFDGQTKAMNKYLEQYLRCFSFENRKLWVDMLLLAEFSYNMAIHTSTSLTPFKVVYGCDPPQLLWYSSNDRDLAVVSSLLQKRDQVLNQLKSNLLKTQARMKSFTDTKRTKVTYEVGN